MPGIKSIKKNIATGQVNQVIEQYDKRCDVVKGVACGDSESEEEDHVWQPISLDLKDRKKVIDTLNDEEFEWNKGTKDGKESHKNFKEWLYTMGDMLFEIHKKNNDNDIFD